MLVGYGATIHIHRCHPKLRGRFPEGLLQRYAAHFQSSFIGELDGGVRIVQDDGNMKVADQSAEALFAFAQGFIGTALLGEVGQRNENVGDSTEGIELRNGVQECPDHFLGLRIAPSDYKIVEGTARTDHCRDQALRTGKNRAIFAKNFQAKIYFALAGDLFDGHAEHIQSGGIGILNMGLGVAGYDANMEIFDEGAETLFAIAKRSSGAALFGEIGYGDNYAGYFTTSVKFGDGADEGPGGVRGAEARDADHLTLHRTFCG